LKEIHAKMSEEFDRHDAPFDGIYFCPHHVQSENPIYRKACSCRKPNPGMGHKAAAELGIDTSLSYMIGDKVEDIQFGLNINATPVLVLTGYGQESRLELEARGIHPAFVAETLREAAGWIVRREKGLKRL
jgi:D-glycero-D-manno-heptose 1,7-bisphosphate phosphatase